MPPTSLAIQLDTVLPVASRPPASTASAAISSWRWETAPKHQGRVAPMIDGAEAPASLHPPHRADILGRRAHARRPAPPRRSRPITFHDETGHTVASASAIPAADFDAALLMSGLDGNARQRVVRTAGFLPRRFQPPERTRCSPTCAPLILELSPTRRRYSPVAPRHTNWCCATAACPPASARLMPPSCSPVPPCAAWMFHRRSDQSPTSGAAFRSPRHRPCAMRIGNDGGSSAAPASPAARSSAHRPGRRFEWLERRKPCPPGLRDHVMRALAVRATDEPQAAAAVHELQAVDALCRAGMWRPLSAPWAATSTWRFRPATAGCSWPVGCTIPTTWWKACASRPHLGRSAPSPTSPTAFPREDVTAIYKSDSPAGFAAFLPGSPDPAPVLQYRCELLLRSGGRIDIVPPPRPLNPADVRAAVLGSMPPPFVTQAALETCIASAAAPIHAALVADLPAPEVIRHGTPPAYPRVDHHPAIQELRFPAPPARRFRNRSHNKQRWRAEIILVLDSPERAELQHYLHGLFGLYAMPLTLVVHTANHGYSSANCSAPQSPAPVTFCS